MTRDPATSEAEAEGPLEPRNSGFRASRGSIASQNIIKIIIIIIKTTLAVYRLLRREVNRRLKVNFSPVFLLVCLSVC